MVISIPAKASVSSGTLSQHILSQPQITRSFMEPACRRKGELIAKIVRNKKGVILHLLSWLMAEAAGHLILMLF